MAKLLLCFAISLIEAKNIELKEILTKFENMDRVFEELLVRKNTPHVLLSDTKEIM